MYLNKSSSTVYLNEGIGDESAFVLGACYLSCLSPCSVEPEVGGAALSTLVGGVAGEAPRGTGGVVPSDGA